MKFAQIFPGPGRRRSGTILFALLAAFGLSVHAAEAPKTPAPIDFNHEIRPILSENCYKCHGPDEGARKAKLRLDLRPEALKPAKSGAVAIVPGAPDKSELVARITATDPDDRMPPLKSGKKLTPAQIETLSRWIAQGAPYAIHWSYVKPVRPALPQVQDTSWPKNEVDRFILGRLEKEKLKPSPLADRYTLIRRAALDLTGLPPTLEEVDQFVNDTNPRAYENLVDRLLRKPAYGEHWARLWLDLARYADSAGYADDPPRKIWAYRDYVIRAFNTNKPFDRFTIEQLAGDLLDDPDDEDRVGTAFHRNTMTNNEGGTSDEEFRNAAVVDRVNTTMSVWMATSLGCAQCHTHKYDPLTQREYFQMFAFFNNTADADRLDEAPVLEFFTEQQTNNRVKWQAASAALEAKFRTSTPKSLASQAEWEKRFSPSYGYLQGSAAESERVAEFTPPPAELTDTLATPPADRTEEQRSALTFYYRAHIDPDLKSEQDEYATVKKQLAQLKPESVPIMRELAGDKRRKTHLEFRGNYLALGEEVTEGVPAAFPPLPDGAPLNRLTLARWLVDENNPLTARVIANRFWEQIFGVGIVRTSEDFGSQGDLPTHPELLDWLATELVRQKWDLKAFLKMLVTSAAYCQSSRVTPEMVERDPDNLLLARGPRFRMSAEIVRDQALSVSGLLSGKMFGPSVRPPQPALGLTAAFGSSLDWATSEGDDRYRRALYVEWRRTSPYPSMATFDAPSREVCTLRRPRSNTPLQALVIMNDPVYVEAAQALGRRMAKAPGAVPEQAEFGFRLCLARPPVAGELKQIVRLYEDARTTYAKAPDQAKKLATDPLGPPGEGADLASLAAWTTVGNLLLNLDEMLMRP